MLSVENKPNSELDIGSHDVAHCLPMTKKPTPDKIGFRPRKQDHAIITRLREKLGVDNSQIIRLALRRLAEHEGLKAS